MKRCHNLVIHHQFLAEIQRQKRQDRKGKAQRLHIKLKKELVGEGVHDVTNANIAGHVFETGNAIRATSAKFAKSGESF